jgi:membrane fusion protein, multidrug efflux system
VPKDTPADAAAAEANSEAVRQTLTRRFFVWILPAIVVGIMIWMYGSAGRFVSTDDAYLQQDRVDVAAQVSGDVTDVMVAENQRVDAGQPLIQLDDANLKLAVIAAESKYLGARTEIHSLQAAWHEKRGEVAVARSAAEFSRRELARQAELAERKLVSAAALDAAQRASALSEGTINVLELQLAQTIARLGGKPATPIEQNPLVLAAAAELQRARLDLSRTRIKAPQAGVVSHLPKVGGRLDAGQTACAIVVDRGIWIEANFKETDLEWVRAGQAAEIDVDTFPNHQWSGKIESISQATGAAFSILPAQNASGNWVKVVQRIPVRVLLRPGADDPPLRNGMSAVVTVDTGPHTRFDRWFGRWFGRSP